MCQLLPLYVVLFGTFVYINKIATKLPQIEFNLSNSFVCKLISEVVNPYLLSLINIIILNNSQLVGTLGIFGFLAFCFMHNLKR